MEQINKTIETAKEQLAHASERFAIVREQYESLRATKNEAIAHQVAELRMKFHEAQRELKYAYQLWKAMLNGYMKLTTI